MFSVLTDIAAGWTFVICQKGAYDVKPVVSVRPLAIVCPLCNFWTAEGFWRVLIGKNVHHMETLHGVHVSDSLPKVQGHTGGVKGHILLRIAILLFTWVDHLKWYLIFHLLSNCKISHAIVVQSYSLYKSSIESIKWNKIVDMHLRGVWQICTNVKFIK